ncbi:hypothetical protein EDD36DRAFT_481703 [Exophiala viscosa]|uniref:Uncharacterized protein n=1 Tax=Exophiala viscosa TaxID=2486360 RepID=A0AAN6I9Y5_9EURO|nr:hypothetical protein EDD36DRAFT_481703 [Exophiala viscosa]
MTVSLSWVQLTGISIAARIHVCCPRLQTHRTQLTWRLWFTLEPMYCGKCGKSGKGATHDRQNRGTQSAIIYIFIAWLSLFNRSYSQRKVTVSPDTGMIPHKEECIPVSSRCCYHVVDQEKRYTRQVLMVFVVVVVRLIIEKEEKVGRREEEYLYRIVGLSRITRALFTAPSNAEPPRNSNRGWRGAAEHNASSPSQAQEDDVQQSRTVGASFRPALTVFTKIQTFQREQALTVNETNSSCLCLREQTSPTIQPQQPCDLPLLSPGFSSQIFILEPTESHPQSSNIREQPHLSQEHMSPQMEAQRIWVDLLYLEANNLLEGHKSFKTPSWKQATSENPTRQSLREKMLQPGLLCLNASVDLELHIFLPKQPLSTLQ